MKRSLIAAGCCIAVLGLTAFAMPRRAPVIPYWAFITQVATNNVTVVDLSTVGFPVVTTIATGPAPKGIVMAPNLKRAYVMNSGAGNLITIIDTNTLVAVGNITLAGGFNQGVELLISPDEAFVWAAGQISPMDGAVSKISTATNTEIEVVNIGEINGTCFDMAYQGGATPRVYVTFPNNGVVCQIRYDGGIAANSSGLTKINTLPSARWLDVSPDSSRLYVTQTPGISPVPVVLATNDWSVVPPSPVPMTGIPAGVGTGDDYNEVRFGTQLPTPTAYLARNFIAINEIQPIDGATDGGVGLTLSTASSVPNALSIDPSNTFLLVGVQPGFSTLTMEVVNITSANFPNSFGTLSVNIADPWRAAFAPPNPKPFINDACSHGGPTSGGDSLRIFGGNFAAGAQFAFDLGAGPITVIPLVVSSSELVVITPSAGGFARADLIVTNPDTQSAILPSFYLFTNTAAVKSVTVVAGTTAPEYRMISFPLITPFPTVKTAIETTFGPYDPQVYRVFFYDPMSQGYLELPTMGPNACDAPGRSLWILSRFGGLPSVAGLDTGAGSADFVLSLDPGWNMISFPFDNGQPFPNNAGTWNPVGANPVQITQDFVTLFNGFDTLNPLGDGRLIEWNGAGYGTVNVMEPGRGYWVVNATSSTVYLLMTDPTFKPGDPPPAKTWAPLAPGSSSPPAPPGSLGSGDASGGGPNCSFAAKGEADPLPGAAMAVIALLAALRMFRR